jgi:hypothetical protein
MTTSFAVTYDYRCPFARNAHDHLITALDAGADWDVTFLPFSLRQVHVTEGEPDVWDEPDKDSGLFALEVSVVVRDRHPDQFRGVHRELFGLRHEQAKSLRDPDLVAKILADHGVDAEAVFADVATGRPRQLVKDEHTRFAASHGVWGVPTFLVGDQAAFIRFMHRPEGDADVATSTIQRVLDLLAWPELNEFKHTSIPR